MVWNNDRAANPHLPLVQSYGWERKGEEWLPVLTKLLPAPEAIIQLVKCACAKQRLLTNICQCSKAGLNCTDWCTCSDGEACDNDCCADDLLEIEDDDSDDDIS